MHKGRMRGTQAPMMPKLTSRLGDVSRGIEVGVT